MNATRNYFSSVLLLSCTVVRGQDYATSWAQRLASSMSTGSVTSIAARADGAVVTTGWFTATLDLNPTQGSQSTSSNGLRDCFAICQNANGAYQWSFTVGGAQQDQTNDSGTDADGNLYIVGEFSGSVDFDPSTSNQILESVGGKDLFVAKYDVTGAFQWAIKIGSSQDDIGQKIAVNASGTVVIIGQLGGSTDVNPGVGVNTLAAGPLVAVYNSTGDYQWAHRLNDYAPTGGVGIDSGGSVYRAGTFISQSDFDPGPGIALLTSEGAGWDSYLQKFQSTGNHAWAIAFGGPNGGGGATTLSIGTTGVYVGGGFDGVFDFDSGQGTTELNSNWTDGFVAKYSATGGFRWARRIASTADDVVSDISIAPHEVLGISGHYAGTLIDPYFDGTLVNAGNWDGFIVVMDSTGNCIHRQSVAGAGGDDVTCISAAMDSSFYCSGYFGPDPVDFNPYGNPMPISGLSAASNMFILRLADDLANTIHEVEGQKTLQIIPNPAEHSVSVLSESLMLGSSVRLVAVDGRELKRWLGNGSQLMELNVSTVVPGSYYIIVSDERGNRETAKLTIH